VIEIEIGF